MISFISILVLFIPFSSSFPQKIIDSQIIFENVVRHIDLNIQIVNIRNLITVKNEYAIPVVSILHTTEQARSNLAYLGARASDTKEKITIVEHKNTFYWTLTLNKSLDPGESTTIEVEERWTNLIEPYPQKIITTKQKQFVRYGGNVYLSSPYKIKQISTKIEMGTTMIKNFTYITPTNISAGNIIYGPYFDINVHSTKNFELHYEKNIPFLVVKNLERVIKVSHLGPIHVEETTELINAGAQFIGSFSRYDFKYGNEFNAPYITTFEMILPSYATDIYYKDDIGIIYTYNVHHYDDFNVMKLKLRFPLLGGWKTKYTVSYVVPNNECVFKADKNEEYVLKVKVLDHIFDDIIVNKLTTKIILPENVQNVMLHTPFEIDRLPDMQYRAFMDTTGRTVITLSKENVISDYKQDLLLRYKYSILCLLNKPLILSSSIFCLLFVFIVYWHLDLTIKPKSKKNNRKFKQ